MKLFEITGTKGRTVIELARQIESVWLQRPLNIEAWNWLTNLSNDMMLSNNLLRISRKCRHAVIDGRDSIFLADASSCAHAYNILDRVRFRNRSS